METNNTTDRRTFIKVSSAALGGLMLNFGEILKAPATPSNVVSGLKKLTGFVSIATDGTINIQSYMPEIGQNVKTTMPMILADELDANWDNVTVIQAPLNTQLFGKQLAGGSQSIRRNWSVLRRAGANARQMLVQAAAKKWKTSAGSLKTENSNVIHPNGEKLSYGELAMLAAKEQLPQNVRLKNNQDFTIIGTKKLNVDGEDIATGKANFGIDTRREGMCFAVALRPPAFGMTLIDFDDTEALKISGVQQVFSFGNNKIAVVATTTWAAMKGKEALKVNWRKPQKVENSEQHSKQLSNFVNSPKTGRDIEKLKTAFKQADNVIEREYEAPFLPHNALEPLNFFAHVTNEKVELYGPTQRPDGARVDVARLLKRPEKDVTVGLSRMGGGFGRRTVNDFVVEAAQIADKSKKPILLTYSREDDMTAGIYRPASKYRFEASIKNNEVTAMYAEGAIFNQKNAIKGKNFPFGAINNFHVKSGQLKNGVTIGPWRAPVSNFLAFAEQTFIDELAEVINKDPVAYRLELLEKAKKKTKLSYNPDRFIGVVKLAAEKSNWSQKKDKSYLGFSMYFSHATYAAEVAEVKLVDGKIKVVSLTVAADCGIVVNPEGAKQQAMGGALDGLGHAMFGDMKFEDGKPTNNNFNTYRLIRMNEAPKVDVHFVESNVAPTGLGEPLLPPASSALANAIYKATGKRLYNQPFVNEGIEFAV